MTDLKHIIDKSWTLFLDRDGVINKRIVDDYVKKWKEFEFLPGVPESIKVFTEKFGKIIVITNQQGVGKNLMDEETLNEIHQRMIEEIKKKGGRIDAVYYCADLKEKKDNCRKPSIKMFEMAIKDFPDIKPEKSIMAGDSASDIEFGKNAGMVTISIGNKNLDADFHFNSLKQFADYLT